MIERRLKDLLKVPGYKGFIAWETLCTCTHTLTGQDALPRHQVQEANWMSEEEMFEATEARSTPSIHSAIDRSVENIAHRKSRVSSQENGKQVETNLLSPSGNKVIFYYVEKCEESEQQQLP